MNLDSRVIRFSILMVVAGALRGQQLPDPPSRVARLNYMDGSVSFRPGNVEEWAGATLNYPLTDGDRLWTDKESRAELHIGATAIHMAEQTAFGILKLDDHLTQMSLAQGPVYLRIPRLEEDEIYEMDTPSGAIIVRRTGDYRFDVSEDGNATLATVRAGEAEATIGGHRFLIQPAQTLRLTGTEQVNAEVIQATPPDPWEEWCLGRDRLSERSMETSESYVPAAMTGIEDLAASGDWSTDSIYGSVWSPRDMGRDWCPYRFGHWAYVAPWGWTWIDDARWGFAPFHYGRWVHTQNGWVWVPGGRPIRPVYSPALVTFVGARGLGAAVGNVRFVAWVPLGPGDVFRPHYRASERYVRNVNTGQANFGAPNRALVNRASMTAVSQTTFAGARRVSDATLRVLQGTAGSVAPVSLDDVRPGRESYLGRAGQPGVRVAAPPAAVAGRHVMARQETPSVPARIVAPVRGESTRPASADVPSRGEVQQQRAEQQRVESQRAEQQRAEQQRVESQRAESQRAEQQRAEQQRAESQRADQQRAEQQRAESQRAEQQRAEQQRAESQRAEQQRVEQQRAEQRRAETQRAEQHRAEQQRAEQQRAEQQRAESQRAEQQRQAEQHRAEQQRAEQQRAEQQRAEQQRAEQQRAESQRAEQQRQAEQHRAEQQRAESQRAEQQRQTEQQKQAEDSRKAAEESARKKQ